MRLAQRTPFQIERHPVVATLLGLLALVAAAMLFAVNAHRTTADAAGANTPGIGALRNGTAYPTGSGYDRYSYVTVGVGDAAKAGALATKSLVYMSGTSVQTSWSTGVSYAEAAANNWLLKDSSGNFLRTPYGAYVADLGNSAYQQRWAENVAAFLSKNGNEGVFIDDMYVTLAGWNMVAAKYPSHQAWEDATVSFAAKVGPYLKARGYYVATNGHAFIPGDSRSDTQELTVRYWQRLGPHVSGLHFEYWLQLPTDRNTLRSAGTGSWTQHWDAHVNLIKVAQNTGADFLGLMYGSTSSVRHMQYGKASFLLEWDGSGGAFVFEVSGDPWNAEWTTDIGTPTGSRFAVGVGWRRNYTGGTAIVNPSPSTSQTFSLGGTYYRMDGTAVTSVTLSPTTGLVLRGSAGSSPAPAANRAPVSAPDTYTVTAGTTLQVPAKGVLANDSDLDGNVLSAAVATAPAHGTLTLRNDGSFTYQPAASFIGVDTFTYTASDGTARSTVATVSLTVQALSGGGSATSGGSGSSSSGGPGNSGNGKTPPGKAKQTEERKLAAAVVLKWDGRLFSSVPSFRQYLTSRGVDWARFLERRPAVAASLGLRAVRWEGRSFYTLESLKGWFDGRNVSFERWAKRHATALKAFTAEPKPIDMAKSRQLTASTLVTWDTVRFTSKRAFRTYLEARGVNWQRFLDRHPGIAAKLAKAAG